MKTTGESLHQLLTLMYLSWFYESLCWRLASPYLSDGGEGGSAYQSPFSAHVAYIA